MPRPAWLDAKCTLSATLSCGCRWRRSKEPFPAVEAVCVGIPKECPKHGDVVLVRVTTYLEPG